jgi:hypothetical protein
MIVASKKYTSLTYARTCDVDRRAHYSLDRAFDLRPPPREDGRGAVAVRRLPQGREVPPRAR